MAVAWRLVQTVALIAYCVGCWGGEGKGKGPTGATSRLGYRGFCKADQGDRLAWCLRSNFETLKIMKFFEIFFFFWNFNLIVRATEAIGRSDFSNVKLYGILQGRPGWFETFKTMKFWFDCQGDRGGRSLWFLKHSLVAKLGVRVSPRCYLLTWGMTVDTDQGVWCSWSRGWLDLF